MRATNARGDVFPSSSFSSSLGFSAPQRAGAKTFAKDAIRWYSSSDDQNTGWKMNSLVRAWSQNKKDGNK